MVSKALWPPALKDACYGLGALDGGHIWASCHEITAWLESRRPDLAGDRYSADDISDFAKFAKPVSIRLTEAWERAKTGKAGVKRRMRTVVGRRDVLEFQWVAEKTPLLSVNYVSFEERIRLEEKGRQRRQEQNELRQDSARLIARDDPQLLEQLAGRQKYPPILGVLVCSLCLYEDPRLSSYHIGHIRARGSFENPQDGDYIRNLQLECIVCHQLVKTPMEKKKQRAKKSADWSVSNAEVRQENERRQRLHTDWEVRANTIDQFLGGR